MYGSTSLGFWKKQRKWGSFPFPEFLGVDEQITQRQRCSSPKRFFAERQSTRLRDQEKNLYCCEFDSLTCFGVGFQGFWLQTARTSILQIWRPFTALDSPDWVECRETNNTFCRRPMHLLIEREGWFDSEAKVRCSVVCWWGSGLRTFHTINLIVSN